MFCKWQSPELRWKYLKSVTDIELKSTLRVEPLNILSLSQKKKHETRQGLLPTNHSKPSKLTLKSALRWATSSNGVWTNDYLIQSLWSVKFNKFIIYFRCRHHHHPYSVPNWGLPANGILNDTLKLMKSRRFSWKISFPNCFERILSAWFEFTSESIRSNLNRESKLYQNSKYSNST